MNGETYTKYYNKPYAIGGGVLNVGDTVTVHPSSTSQSRQPYTAKIIESVWHWHIKGKRKELCTEVRDGHSAVINDYLFNRLQLLHRGR